MLLPKCSLPATPAAKWRRGRRRAAFPHCLSFAASHHRPHGDWRGQSSRVSNDGRGEWRRRYLAWEFKLGTLKDVLTDEVVEVVETPLPGDVLDVMLNGPIGEAK
jgi:hypothetical protein